VINLTYNRIVKELIAKLKSAYKIENNLSDKTDVMELDIDSLDMMDYIFFIEETYGIKVEDEKIQAGGFLIIGETAKFILSER